jgi:hypothetical protein
MVHTPFTGVALLEIERPVGYFIGYTANRVYIIVITIDSFGAVHMVQMYLCYQVVTSIIGGLLDLAVEILPIDDTVNKYQKLVQIGTNRPLRNKRS